MKKSESIKEIAISLAKFNGEIGRIQKDGSNPFFKSSYATLDNIIDNVRPILQKHGLSIIQSTICEDEKVGVSTLLIHESGEWMETEPLMMKPVKIDPQQAGSVISYLRRYSLTSFLSLSLGTGPDDDGNAATFGHTNPNQYKPEPKPYPRENMGSNTPSNSTGGGKMATEPQIKRLLAKLNVLAPLRESSLETLKNSYLKKHGISSFDEMSSKDIWSLTDMVQKMIEAGGFLSTEKNSQLQ
jgi:hypothetical protein